ncbi:hypothetical protein F7725_018494 [Dissostichus mawsoni]|uniref:Protein tyrosine phosphatase non-receptor type 3 n=1 Tax=Dissostichus mawsoni TaxID=36200 RepID=A0A7J5XT72_DISMA|nr:hypothetical protein F7725_018494 [Dissostichus mawsoni]
MPKLDLLCLVQLLDGTIETFRVSKQDEGVVLLDLVCDHLGLQERQLFSLQIRESSTAIASITANTHTPRWLEPEKPLKKQIKGTCTSSRSGVTLEKDAETGDHCPSRYPGYLSKCFFIPEQDEDFLSKDTNDAPLMVGLASSGVAIFCNMICSSFFPWGNIIKISFKRKRFLIHLKRKHGETQDCEVSLVLPCPKTCKNLWRSCVDHHSFFSSNRTARSPRNNNSTVQAYKKLITQHLGLSNTKTESGPVGQVVGGDGVEPSPAEVDFVRSPRDRERSPRVRHGIHKPRPSSVELTNDMKDMSEGEDVFYTYRASVSSSKDSEGDNSPHHGPGSPSHDEASMHIDGSIGEDDAEHSSQHYQKGALGDGDLMLLCIAPDHDGKFGFIVKAGRCEPKLLEGDLIVLINGRDISEHTHDQVVMFIKASRGSHSRELALLIRRKGPGRVAPLLQLPPALTLTCQSQGGRPLPSPSERVKTLEESMRQLERGIQSGTLCFHFENLYRRKPGLTLNCARLSENMDKNRYKDVLPYDATRVVLQGQEDYINASHITVRITDVAPPESGVCLRYVAAQGPLPQTCTHFWQTVWEQQTHTIIMLTTLTERGRTKCHQYWPHPPEVKDYGHMRVKCHSEECNLAYRGEERAVTHLQYVAWPDHGVPDDPSDFLLFISSVRERRRGEEPLMVHCSAGIGRTGVLITMETALAQLDGGQPVFPLDIVKTVRDQRAMMVQTTCQFQFVCEAILRVYKEKQEGSSAPNRTKTDTLPVSSSSHCKQLPQRDLQRYSRLTSATACLVHRLDNESITSSRVQLSVFCVAYIQRESMNLTPSRP